MKSLKFIFIKIFKFIFIMFGIFGLFCFFYFIFGFFAHREYVEGKKSANEFILTLIKQNRPTKDQFIVLFGKERIRYDSSKNIENKKLTPYSKDYLGFYLSFPSVKEKFEKYDSMIAYQAGWFYWFIFFDKEGRMVDFEIIKE